MAVSDRYSYDGLLPHVDETRIPEYIRPNRVTYFNAFKRFYEHPYGQHLAGQELRFSAHYGYEDAYDEPAMGADLGQDVYPQGHNILTYAHVQSVIHMERGAGRYVDPYEQAVALFAAGIHDMGESKHPDLAAKVGRVIGDIPFGQKTQQDYETEAAIRRVEYKEIYWDFPPHFIRRVEGVISHSDHTSPAALLMEIGHTILFLRTGLRAARIILAERSYGLPPGRPAGQDRPPQRTAQLEALARIVTGNVVPLLEPLAAQGVRAAQIALGSTVVIRRRIVDEIEVPRGHVGLR